MRISDLIMTAAVILGPILSVRIQQWIELQRQQRERKLWLFRTLMLFRGNPQREEHVQALNLIDIEFDSRDIKDVSVREAWRQYLNHLNNAPQRRERR